MSKLLLVLKNKKIVFFLKALVSSTLLIYLASLVDFEKLDNLGLGAIAGIFFAVVIYLFMLVFLSLRWKVLLNMQDGERKMSLKASYRGYLLGMFFNMFFPSAIGGDIVRVKYAADKVNVGIRKSTMVIVVERLFGFFTLLLVFSLGIFYNPKVLDQVSIQIADVVVLLMLLAILLLIVNYLSLRYVKMDIRTSTYIFIFSIIPHFAEAFAVGVIAWSIGVNIDLLTLIFIVPLVKLATILPISLGGLGVREGVLVALLALFGISIDDGIAISLILLLVLIIIGLFGTPRTLKRI